MAKDTYHFCAKLIITEPSIIPCTTGIEGTKKIKGRVNSTLLLVFFPRPVVLYYFFLFPRPVVLYYLFFPRPGIIQPCSEALPACVNGVRFPAKNLE